MYKCFYLCVDRTPEILGGFLPYLYTYVQCKTILKILNTNVTQVKIIKYKFQIIKK